MKRKTSLNLVLASIAVAIALITAAAFWFYHSPYGPTIPLIRTGSSQSITQPDRPSPKIVQSARNQIGKTLRYDSAYTKLKYPMGDVPMKKRRVHRRHHPRPARPKYGFARTCPSRHEPKLLRLSQPLGLKQPDANIDHRRVPNLMTYFTRQAGRYKIRIIRQATL